MQFSIYEAFVRDKDCKRNLCSGRSRLTSFWEEQRIRNLVWIGNYYFSQIKNTVRGQIPEKNTHRRVLESGYVKNRKIAKIIMFETTL